MYQGYHTHYTLRNTLRVRVQGYGYGLTPFAFALDVGAIYIQT
jgi:hypothetical protein